MSQENKSIGYGYYGWFCRVVKHVGALVFVRYVGLDGNLQRYPTYIQSERQAQLISDNGPNTFEAAPEEIRLAHLYAKKEAFLSLPEMEGIDRSD